MWLHLARPVSVDLMVSEHKFKALFKVLKSDKFLFLYTSKIQIIYSHLNQCLSVCVCAGWRMGVQKSIMENIEMK